MWIAAKEGSGAGAGETLNVTEVIQADGVLNFMWMDGNDGVEEGTHYWELTLTDAQKIFFGVTSKEHFKDGYKLRGLLFGGPGNVADGIQCLIAGWGPEAKSGDTVGVLVEFVYNLLNVSFFVNKRAVGKAFSLARPFPSPLFPVASFGSGPQQVTIAKMAPPPDCTPIAPRYQGFEGNWAIINPYTEGNIVRLMVKQESEDKYALLARCANSIRTMAKKSPTGQWSSGPCMSTMMYSAQWCDTEDSVQSLLSSITNLELTTDQQLRITGANDQRLFKRYEPARPEPVERVEFS